MHAQHCRKYAVRRTKGAVKAVATSAHCPLCQLEAELENSRSRTFPFNCRRCGKFEITEEAAGVPDELRPYLSSATRQASESGRRLKITTTNARDLAESHRRTTVTERLDKLLAVLARKAKSPGTPSVLSLGFDYPLVDAHDERELGAYLGYLQEKGILREVGIPSGVAYLITIDGWRMIEPTVRPGGEPGRCFVASWLDDQMDEPYRTGIDPAVRACGYTPVWMKDIPENKGITDRILSEIRRAEFLVADFTGQRQSVYFEAGFARGLGREVIWCCREDDLSHVHFDTRHLGHVAWKDPDDLRRKLEESIRANIVKPA